MREGEWTGVLARQPVATWSCSVVDADWEEVWQMASDHVRVDEVP